MSNIEQSMGVSPELISKTLDQLTLRKGGYQGIPFEVLEDLKIFCRAETTCFDPDPRIHAVLEGRREVWLRIQEFIRLTPDELLLKLTGNRYSVKDLEGTDYARG